MLDHLEIGDARAVMLVDGVADTPHVVAQLVIDAEHGARLIIPYMDGADEFASVAQWVEEKTSPAHLSAKGKDLRVDLFGVEFGGNTTNYPSGVSELRLDVGELVFKTRDGDFYDPLTVKQLESRIDGLAEWARLQSVESDHESEGSGWTLNNTLFYTVKSVEGLTWMQGDAFMSISTTFSGVSGRGIALDEHTVLRSKFDDAQPVEVHLKEHRRFLQLLSLMFGTSLAFRRHTIRDDRFTSKTLGGEIYGYPSVELISRQTIADYAKEVPSEKALKNPITRMDALGDEALERWSDKSDDWERFVLPISGVYRVPASVSFVENIALNSAMSLEALGTSLVGYVEGEEATYQDGRRTPEWAEKMRAEGVSRTTIKQCKTVATDVYRGIKPLGLNWEGIAASEVGLARAIANHYNTIKHPSKGSFPHPLHSRILSDISSGVVRLNVVKLINDEPQLLAGFGATELFQRPRRGSDAGVGDN